MSKEIVLQALSGSMEEARVVKWLKAVGDRIAAGESICEVETDKAVIEISSPAGGTLGKILVAEGTDHVPVDSVLGLLLEEGESAAVLDQHGAPKTVAAPVAEAVQKVVAAAEAAASRSPERIFASPLARRMAKDAGVDLRDIQGSGPNGRIVKVDVMSALEAKASISAAATAVLESDDEPVAMPAPRTAVPAAPPDNATEVPHTSMRRAIARRLVQSKQTVPHFYLTVDIELDALLAFRQELNSRHPSGKISINDLVVKAAALALRKVPACNASWSEPAVLRYQNVDVSVAVSTDGGLITPIVRGADRKGMAAISDEIRDLADRARKGALKPDEFQGGGFTISNLGMHGIREFAAIINPPQSAILAVGAGEQRAVVKNGSIGIATIMSCTMSVDHRVIDGVTGAEFLAEFKKLLQDPLSMML